MLKAFKISHLKILSFIPALFIMSMIFSFSAQDSGESSSLSASIATQVISLLDQLLALDLTNTQSLQAVEHIHTFIRKLGHFGEYFLLGASLLLPLYTLYHIRGKKVFLIPLTFCILFATTDEIHQLFVDGRCGSPRDVLIDTLGSFTGLLITQVMCYISRKCICEPFQSNAKSLH